MKNDTFSRFRLISFVEGISYLLLVFIAMPLKYMFDYPLAVKIVGMGHGVLFILFFGVATFVGVVALVVTSEFCFEFVLF